MSAMEGVWYAQTKLVEYVKSPLKI
ncbi:hypothetical protein A2U01_0087473, partial [Trifolium medium]|nr:hypothetical protein [Trifolium medium]